MKMIWFRRMLVPKRTIIMPTGGFWIGVSKILEHVRYDDDGLVEVDLPWDIEQAVAHLREWLDIAHFGGLLDDPQGISPPVGFWAWRDFLSPCIFAFVMAVILLFPCRDEPSPREDQQSVCPSCKDDKPTTGGTRHENVLDKSIVVA